MREITMKHGVFVIACLLLQSLALAADFAGGTGEPNDPYQIATAEQLIAIGSDPSFLDKNFVLVADIDLDPNLPGGRVFTNAPIARDSNASVGSHSGASFGGVLDGRGHTIANLHIEGGHGYDVGLFSMLSGLVKDLRLADVVISGSPCGAIAGFNHGGMILRCEVTGRLSGVSQVGGLVGANWDASLVECQAQVRIIGHDEIGGMVGGGERAMLMRCRAEADVNGERGVGGLVGDSQSGIIIECQATGTVVGGDEVGGLIGNCSRTMIRGSAADCDVTGEQTAGGLAGRIMWRYGPLIADCYARGSVAGSVVGGLAGQASWNQFLNCYAACEIIVMQVEGQEPVAGGLFAEVRAPKWAPLTAACFWDMELSGIAESVGSDPVELGTGLNTEQMRSGNVLRDAGWDFDHVWMICEGDYPRLQWEAEDCSAQ
ncbi:MAG: hypothetical protein ACYSWO_20120 [Planctomycetota bacterium]